MTAPWATCARCEADLYPRLARRSERGWMHSTCPRFCGDCGSEIGAKATSGLCRRCYEERRRVAKSQGRGRPVRVATSHESKPCLRCGLPTKAQARVCRDCRDVLGEELERWAA